MANASTDDVYVHGGLLGLCCDPAVSFGGSYAGWDLWYGQVFLGSWHAGAQEHCSDQRSDRAFIPRRPTLPFRAQFDTAHSHLPYSNTQNVMLIATLISTAVTCWIVRSRLYRKNSR